MIAITVQGCDPGNITSSRSITTAISTSFGFSLLPNNQIEKRNFINDDRTLMGLLTNQHEVRLQIIGSHEFESQKEPFIEEFVAGLQRSYSKNGRSIAVKSQVVEPIEYMNRTFDCYLIQVKSDEEENELTVLNWIDQQDCITFVIFQRHSDAVTNTLETFIKPD